MQQIARTLSHLLCDCAARAKNARKMQPTKWLFRRNDGRSTRNMLRHRSLLSIRHGKIFMSTSMQTDQARVWDLIEKITIPMLVTWDGKKLHSRPMAAYANREDGSIYFLFDTRQHKDQEVEAYPEVNLAFADTSGQKYVSVSGSADVLNDRAKIKELFSTPAKAWWQTPDDPNIRILRIAPVEAQYWDAPGTTLSYVKIMLAAVTGSRPDLGGKAKVTM